MGDIFEFPGYGKTNHSTIASLYTTLCRRRTARLVRSDDISPSGTEQELRCTLLT